MDETDTGRTHDTRAALLGTIPEQRDRRAATTRCSCGHGPEDHEHYRAGTDCALCSCDGRGPGLATLLVTLLGRRPR